MRKFLVALVPVVAPTLLALTMLAIATGAWADTAASLSLDQLQNLPDANTPLNPYDWLLVVDPANLDNGNPIAGKATVTNLVAAIGTTPQVASVAALQSGNFPTLAMGGTVALASYYAGPTPDGGGGLLQYIPGPAVVDNGLVFKTGDGKYLQRLTNGAPINTAWYGVSGSGAILSSGVGCTATSPNVTVPTNDFRNGEGIELYGCGAASTAQAPTASVSVASLSTTIVSGTYNNTTGQVILTLTAPLGLKPGMSVTIAGATGTGAYASIDGISQAQTGTPGNNGAGTTLVIGIASGLGATTITGGSINTLGATGITYQLAPYGPNKGVGAWQTLSVTNANAYLSYESSVQFSTTIGTNDQGYFLCKNGAYFARLNYINFWDVGQAPQPAPHWFPGCGTTQAQTLISTVSAGGGTTILTLPVSANTSTSAAVAIHNEDTPLSAWRTAITNGAGICPQGATVRYAQAASMAFAGPVTYDGLGCTFAPSAVGGGSNLISITGPGLSTSLTLLVDAQKGSQWAYFTSTAGLAPFEYIDFQMPGPGDSTQASVYDEKKQIASIVGNLVTFTEALHKTFPVNIEQVAVAGTPWSAGDTIEISSSSSAFNAYTYTVTSSDLLGGSGGNNSVAAVLAQQVAVGLLHTTGTGSFAVNGCWADNTLANLRLWCPSFVGTLSQIGYTVTVTSASGSATASALPAATATLWTPAVGARVSNLTVDMTDYAGGYSAGTYNTVVGAALAHSSFDRITILNDPGGAAPFDLYDGYDNIATRIDCNGCGGGAINFASYSSALFEYQTDLTVDTLVSGPTWSFGPQFFGDTNFNTSNIISAGGGFGRGLKFHGAIAGNITNVTSSGSGDTPISVTGGSGDLQFTNAQAGGSQNILGNGRGIWLCCYSGGGALANGPVGDIGAIRFGGGSAYGYNQAYGNGDIFLVDPTTHIDLNGIHTTGLRSILGTNSEDVAYDVDGCPEARLSGNAYNSGALTCLYGGALGANTFGPLQNFNNGVNTNQYELLTDPVLETSGSYVQLLGESGVTSSRILLGYSGDASIYYDATEHKFETVGGTLLGFIGSGTLATDEFQVLPSSTYGGIYRGQGSSYDSCLGNYGGGVSICTVTNSQNAVAVAGLTADGALTGLASVNFTGLTTGTNADFLCLSSAGAVLVQASACTISDVRLKEHIENAWWAFVDLMKLHPKAYRLKSDPKYPNPDRNFGRPQLGLMAQNVYAVDPRLAIVDKAGNPKTWRPEAVIALLVEGFHEQAATIALLALWNMGLTVAVVVLFRRRHQPNTACNRIR